MRSFSSMGPPGHGGPPGAGGPAGAGLPMAPSGPAAVAPRPARPPVAPRAAERGVVVFDLDGTLLDDLGLISDVAADVLHQAFGTPPDEGRVHYLATTGMPFEAQLAQLYPEAPAPIRASAARTFHQRKVTEAYARAKPFPEVPKLLKTLANGRWNLAVSTGSETEMAELLLEREGLRYWFDDVLGSAEGTKREHLAEYRRRYGAAPIFLVGDSRFDMEAASSSEGIVPLGRASTVRGWTLAPRDLERWGAKWAGFSLGRLPDVLERLVGARTPSRRRSRASGRRA
jgi:phosphoglycolate phosphatase-like HAD superfamily hydrolase